MRKRTSCGVAVPRTASVAVTPLHSHGCPKVKPPHSLCFLLHSSNSSPEVVYLTEPRYFEVCLFVSAKPLDDRVELTADFGERLKRSLLDGGGGLCRR